QKHEGAVRHYPEESPARRLLEARYRRPSVWDSFLHYLARRGYDVPRSQLERDVTRSVEPSPEVRRDLLHIYRNDPADTGVCERRVDLDEGVQEWRYRHVKMVEHTIETKRGTGGSTGAEYLRGTLFRLAFPDLWAIRTEL